MAKATVAIGTVADDGTGDPFRTAFGKINDNFTELYNILGGSTLPTLSAGAVAFAASGAWSQDATNFLYTTTSGPRLQVGSGSTTSAGFLMGYGGLSGYAYIWHTSVTPTTGNYTFAIGADKSNYWSAPAGGSIQLQSAGTTKFTMSTTAGNGIAIAAGTATTDVQALSLTQTLNGGSGVNHTAILATITEGASGTGSGTLIFNYKYGTSGSEKTTIKQNKNGTLTLSNVSSDNPSTLVPVGANVGVGAAIAIGTKFLSSDSYGTWLDKDSPFGWCSLGAVQSAIPDTKLFRDAAYVIAQRNGTNAQEFRVENTYTSSTNREYGKLGWASNVFRVGTVKGSGGGTARALALTTDDTERWQVGATSGHLLPVAGNSYDIGVAGTAMRNLFMAGYQDLAEMTAPAGSANAARIFAQDNGAGKTQLMVIFGSGAAQQIAIEA